MLLTNDLEGKGATADYFFQFCALSAIIGTKLKKISLAYEELEHLATLNYVTVIWQPPLQKIAFRKAI